MQVYSNFWKTFLKPFQVTTSSHIPVKSSRLILIKSNQVESTCGHFSLKLGHISSPSWLSRWHKNRLNVLYQLKNIRFPAHSPRYCWTSCWIMLMTQNTTVHTRVKRHSPTPTSQILIVLSREPEAKNGLAFWAFLPWNQHTESTYCTISHLLKNSPKDNKVWW